MSSERFNHTDHSDPDDTETTMQTRRDGGRRERSDQLSDDDVRVRDRADQVARVDGRMAGGIGGETGGSWQDIKSRFVDDPAGAIAEAEAMVRRTLDERIRALQAEVEAVCAEGRGRGDDASGDASSTEALRNRLLRLQAYCEQLAASLAH